MRMNHLRGVSGNKIKRKGCQKVEILFKTKRGQLKTVVFHRLRQSLRMLNRQSAKVWRRIRSFVLPVLMTGAPTVSWAPVSKATSFPEQVSVLAPENTNTGENNQTGGKYEEQAKNTIAAGSFLNNRMSALVVVDNLESCLKQYGDDIRPDVSQIVLRTEDLALAKGKESETAKKLWDTAVRTYTGPGRCTRNFKRSVVKMGWTSQMTKQDFQAFDRIVPAWGLIPFLDSGKIGSLIPFNMAETDRKNKTMPIEGVVRVNEKGQTRYSHVQVMGPKGAAYGEKRGISQSPEHHRAANGQIQRYGTGHFYLDRGTMLTVLQEMAKTRDMVFILDQNKAELKVFEADCVPEQYRPVVAGYLRRQELKQMKTIQPADALAYRKLIRVRPQLKLPASIQPIDARQILNIKKSNSH